MKKPFLLIAWDLYDAEGGTDDWIGCYKTLEEAEDQVQKHSTYGFYYINGVSYDCYKIVDLREWTETP